mgnify:CR=1 FL=1
MELNTANPAVEEVKEVLISLILAIKPFGDEGDRL